MSTSALLLSYIRDFWYAIIPTSCIAYLLSVRYQSGLNEIPGPWLRSISVLPRMLSVHKGMSQEDDLLLHKRYGKIVRLAPNLVSISDLSVINDIYGIGTKFQKSPFYELSQAHDDEGLIPDPFILTNKELHSRMKRNASNAYSLNGLVQMEPWIEPVTERLIEKLRMCAANGEAVDFGTMLANYFMDGVFALTFGRDFNYLDRGDVLEISKMMAIASWYMAVFGQITRSFQFRIFKPLIAMWAFRSLTGQGEKDMAQLAAAEVENARERTSEEGPMTFLQRLLLNQKSNPKLLHDREIMTHAFGNITAGSDTTATAMRSIVYHVLENPDVYAKLRSEIRDANLSLPVSFAQAHALPYLGFVIKEGMRVHPSVGMLLARTVPVEGAQLCGYQISGGVEVGLNPWVLHRNPEIYTDPDRFWPDRWSPSVSDEERLREMNRAFFTFGHGSHTCSGRWISIMEMTKLIPTLLLHFDMELVDGGKTYEFDNYWFMMQEGLSVKFTSRKREGL